VKQIVRLNVAAVTSTAFALAVAMFFLLRIM
jgi:hypothetical protein